MILNSKGLPFYALFFFYLWTASIEYGFLLGLHLTLIAFSFFILCSPVASYWYLFGALPGALNQKPNIFNVFSLWVFLLAMNILTILTVPNIYGKSLIYRVVFSILTTFPINIFTLGFSGGTLLYHWSISQLKNSSAKTILHFAGIVLSSTTTYMLLNKNQNSIVFYLMDMSYSNF